MEELKAMFRVCAHIKKDGVRCNSPAMKGMNFCYQHIGGNIRELTRARSIYSGPKLDFVYPGCRQAIQHNFFVIAQAMNDGHIDLQTACAYNRIYSACERNLRRFEDLYQKDAEAELAPIPDETPGSEATAPPQPCHPETESVAQATNADEGSAALQPNDHAGAPSFRAASSRERVGEQAPTEPTVQEPTPTFDIQKIDFKKYDPRFKELERLYLGSPDYGDRVRAAILQIHEEEEQAWRAAGCPRPFDNWILTLNADLR